MVEVAKDGLANGGRVFGNGLAQRWHIFSWELSDGAHVLERLILRRSEGCLRGRDMQLEGAVNNVRR